jgi:secreted trypsin-like serine protease
VWFSRRCLAVSALCLLVLTAVTSPALAGARAGQGPRPHVVGGQDAAAGQFPWVAALAQHEDPRDYDAQFCGGTVIAPFWVLTAAHCVLGDISIDEDEKGHVTVEVAPMPASELDVIVGKTDLTALGGERHRAAEIVLHPAATLRVTDQSIVPVADLALVRLRTRTDVTPVALAAPGGEALWAPKVPAEVVGWGSIVDPGGKTPPSYPAKLQHAAIPIVADATCSAPLVHGAAYERASMLCAGAPQVGHPGRGACYGDSGGPLVVQNAAKTAWLQAGIVSWGGATCVSSGQPGVFARVAPLSSFVRATIGFGPFAGAERFVRGQYRDFAGRGPTAFELLRWVHLLSSGTPPWTLIASLNGGEAWQRTAGTVDRLYRAAFNRQVDDRGMKLWVERRNAGWTAHRVGSALAGSAEFVARYGRLDTAGFVDRLYRNALGRTGRSSEIAHWVGRMRAGLTRGQVMAAFSNASEFRRRAGASSTVVTTWYGMLRHVPTGAEVTQWSGRPTSALISTLLAGNRYAARN